jgi:hypothetical protein
MKEGKTKGNWYVRRVRSAAGARAQSGAARENTLAAMTSAVPLNPSTKCKGGRDEWQ